MLPCISVSAGVPSPPDFGGFGQQAKLEAVLRELERGQPGPSGVKVKAE